MGDFLSIAHRGAPRRALENTLESFLLAKSAGAQAFELDVWLTSDGVPVVFHDKDLSRLAGRRERLSSLSFSELSAVSLKGGHCISRLQEVVEALSHPLARVYVEMKDPNPKVVGSSVAVCSDLPGAWVFSSFHHAHLARVKGKHPTQALIDRGFWGRMSALPGEEIGICDEMASPRLLDRLCAGTKPVIVYTVNDEERKVLLRSQGAGGVFTDTW